MLLNWYSKNLKEAGCDEAGRGCLAGPVFAAAVVLPLDFYHPKLNDSKQVKESDRYELRTYIESNAIHFGVASVDQMEIDKINILNASFLAMHRAIDLLSNPPQHLLIDGNRFTPYFGISHQCIIKGDEKYTAIAAASILAKTYRDDYMKNIANDHDGYGWEHNMGYATLMHRNAILELGLTDHHRLSFCKNLYKKVPTKS